MAITLAVFSLLRAYGPLHLLLVSRSQGLCVVCELCLSQSSARMLTSSIARPHIEPTNRPCLVVWLVLENLIDYAAPLQRNALSSMTLRSIDNDQTLWGYTAAGCASC